jgi:subtilisin family serine protease
MDPALWEMLEGDDDDEIEAIIRLRDPGTAPEGVRLVAQFGHIATCRLRRGSILDVRANETVASLKAPRLVIPDLDVEPPIDENLSPEGAEPTDQRRPSSLEVTGRGVVVGIVDWGCDFAHPNFRHADGTTRIKALWDQRSPEQGAANRYGYGTIHTSQDIDRALTMDDPYAALRYHPADGDPRGRGAHGTHVMDIAAGNGRAGGPVGVAPEADLVFVHLATRGTGGLASLGDSKRVLEAMEFIFRTAGPSPCASNLSVGRTGGDHTGTSLVEQGLDAAIAAAPGRAIAQSTGNYFNQRMHTFAQLRPGEARTFVWHTDAADVTPNELEVWYPGRDALVAEVRSPDGTLTWRVPLGERASLEANGRKLGNIYHRARDPNNHDHHVDIFLYPEAPAGAWEVTLVGEDVVDGRLHAWVERDAACTDCQSRFDLADAVPSSTTGTICNGFRTIAVGAYNPHSQDRELAPFSSSGPTRDGRQKPDLIAPGESILAARSAPRDAHADVPLHTRKSGTSMAAPHVTGTIALMFEAARRPLEISETRRLLLSSTHGVTAPEEVAARLGSGYLDIKAAVEAARQYAEERQLSFGETAPVLENAQGPENVLEMPVSWESLLSLQQGTLVDSSLAEAIHSRTFHNARERRGRRRGIEIEATMHLVCADSEKTIDPKHLYELLSRDEWRAFRQIRRCAKCAAFSSGFGVANMPWDQISHDLREQNPYVWLTVEPGRFDRQEQRLERKVGFGTDLMDDFYFDDDDFTLLSNSYLLRGRKRWDNWRHSDDVSISRLLIATKKIDQVSPEGIKVGHKHDVRLNNPNVRQRHIDSLVSDIQAGFFDWTNNPTERRRNRTAIGPIKNMYNELMNSGALSRFKQGGRSDILDLKPQVFIRSLRSRYHLRETRLADIESIRQNGETKLETLRDNARQALRENSLDSALRPDAQAFVDKGNRTLDFSLVADRARSELTSLHPTMTVAASSVRALRPRARGRVPSTHRELEKQRVVAETINKLYHELANDAKKNGLINAISGVSANEGQEWIRQIEAAGSAGLGLWFDRARRFYVPDSRRGVNADFLIDTLDASGMFTPDAWAGTPIRDQTNQNDPDIGKLFHASLANEIQIELGRERAYLRCIRRLERRIAQAAQPSRNLQERLSGAKFVLDQYRNALATLVQMKEDQVINGIKGAIADARQAGQAVPDCNNWAWIPVTQGKGETALSILKQRKQKSQGHEGVNDWLGSELVELTDEAICAGELCHSSEYLINQVLSRIGITETLDPLNAASGSFTSPAVIFDALAPGGSTSLRRHLVQFFEIVAQPGAPLEIPLESGDILLRRALGEGNLAHLGFLVSGEIVNDAELASRGLIAEGNTRGMYAHILEDGVRTHTRSDSFARLVLDPTGRLPLDQMILRPKWNAHGVSEQVILRPPPSRPCCILAPTIRPFSRTSNLLDPSQLGSHRGRSESSGIVYTGKAGFLDVGHIRDLCDLTKYIYDQIVAANDIPSTLRTTHGVAEGRMCVVPSQWIKVARAIAYDDSFGYEIATYYLGGPGQHNSSFSPEDLCSNYLGTLVAERAIARGGNFNAAVTTELKNLIASLDGQSRTESLNAFNLINHRWVDFRGVTSLVSNGYLRRRNFTRTPWHAGHRSDSPTPAWVTAGVGDVLDVYTYTHTAGRRIPRSQFPTHVSQIRADARRRYGSNYDRP